MRYIKDRFDWVVNNTDKNFNFTEQGFRTTKNFSNNNTINNFMNMLRMPDQYELGNKFMILVITYSLLLIISCNPNSIHKSCIQISLVDLS